MCETKAWGLFVTAAELTNAPSSMSCLQVALTLVEIDFILVKFIYSEMHTF